ncbi:glycosyltransferase [Salmonella enterica]|nr:glycosyltransferase [Salmonella enterica]
MISVIMAVNRLDKYVHISIESILQQTYQDFELIIVANGIDCARIVRELSKFSESDYRVKIYSSPIGQLAFALNFAISKCNYSIVARMDSDDISFPERLEKQYKYLQYNNLDLVGTAICLIDENNSFIKKITYPGGPAIKKNLPFKNCFAHPSVMFRKDFFLKYRGYCGGFNSEDYDLWFRMLSDSPRWDNMLEPLLSYRVHANSTQKSKLAYYECASYSLREFLKNRTVINFFSLIYHCSKALIK